MPSAVGLDVIAITDHERVDAAHAARAMAEARGLDLEVIVGEEITTRGGHLVALFIEQAHQAVGLAPRRRSRGSTSRAAWRSSPIRSCPTRCAPVAARSGSCSTKQMPTFHPDAIEAFNPTTGRHALGRARPGVRQGGRRGRGRQQRRPPRRGCRPRRDHLRRPDRGRSAQRDPRARRPTGRAAPTRGGHQLSTFRRQMGKNAAARARRTCAARSGATAPGRDLGYPGGRRRPARLDESELAGRERAR